MLSDMVHRPLQDESYVRKIQFPNNVRLKRQKTSNAQFRKRRVSSKSRAHFLLRKKPGYPLQFPAPGGGGEFRFYPLRGRETASLPFRAWCTRGVELPRSMRQLRQNPNLKTLARFASAPRRQGFRRFPPR
jgi:hypothetical protein